MNTHHNLLGLQSENIFKLHNKMEKQRRLLLLTCFVCLCVCVCVGVCVCVCVCVCAQLPTSRADQLNSCAAAGCASMPAGGVTANTTVTTNQMRKTAVSSSFYQNYRTDLFIVPCMGLCISPLFYLYLCSCYVGVNFFLTFF